MGSSLPAVDRKAPAPDRLANYSRPDVSYTFLYIIINYTQNS